MKVTHLTKNHPYLSSLATLILGALLLLGIQKVFADTTIYYACVKTSNGSIRMVSSTTTCGSGETLISWNQTGPQGIQGPPGPTGTPGSGGDIFSLKPFLCSNCDLSAYPDKFVTQDWSNSQLYGIILNNDDIHGVNFSGSIITEGQMQNDNLSNANFSGIKGLGNTLITTVFDNSNLTNANFSNIQVSFWTASFNTSNLEGADFSNDTFARTHFNNANLQSTNFTNATFNSLTDFTGATNMNTANLTNVTWDGAICPDGSHDYDHPDPDTGNPTCVNNLTPTPTPTP